MITNPENHLKEYDTQKKNKDYFISENTGKNTSHKGTEWRKKSLDKFLCPMEESVMSNGVSQATPNLQRRKKSIKDMENNYNKRQKKKKKRWK